jgi:prepilin-type N-terminal cleavage/methylation domain-containing protein
MMSKKLGWLNKSQKGFTILELMTALGISGVIAAAVMTTFYQVVTGSARTGGEMTAVKQVEQAGYWVSRDAQMAQSIIYDDPYTTEVTEFLTLSWTGWDNAEHTVHYILDEETGELQRDDGEHQIRVAQFLDVDPEMTNCDFADTNGDNTEDTLIFKVTAVVGNTLPMTREYRIVPRALY